MNWKVDPLVPNNNRSESNKLWEHSVIRWAGSKRKLLPTLMSNVPATFERYIEPFCGSACLFFAIKPKNALLSDINRELITAFEQIKAHPRIVAREVAAIPVNAETYNAWREKDPDSLVDLDRAVRFLFLNRNCFNGVYRTNREGKFNVPMGRRTGLAPDEKRYYRSHIALRGAYVQVSDFAYLNEEIRKGDFIYLDPPYAKNGTRDRGEYGPGAFKLEDLARLLKLLRKADRVGAKFLLSYSDDQSLRDMLPSRWYCRHLEVNRHVSGFAKHRKRVTEVLISNRAIKV